MILTPIAKIFQTPVSDIPLSYPCKGRDNVSVLLKNSYTFNWERIDKWHFLELTIIP